MANTMISQSQRVVLKKEIASRLSGEEWPIVDMTLEEFSLPTSPTWPGTRESYVLNAMKGASDQTLIDLAQHVGFQFEEATKPRIDPPFWRKGMFRLFVSHISKHRAYASDLQLALLDFGISAFIAHKDIEPTQEWQVQIETALATCDALVALLHESFHASNWTDQELGFAMGRGVPTFAVRFGQVPYGFIGRFQAFDGNRKTPIELARELFDAYRKNKQTQRRISDVLVGLFEESGTFAEAKARVGYLEELENWEPSFSSRIRSAAKSNFQISESWGVLERVKALAKKWESLR